MTSPHVIFTAAGPALASPVSKRLGLCFLVLEGAFGRRDWGGLWSCSLPFSWFPACACRPVEPHTFLLWSTADGERMPLVACDAGDIQVQVVAWPVVEERGPLNEEMGDLGREEGQGDPCGPKVARAPRPRARGQKLGHPPPPLPRWTRT